LWQTYYFYWLHRQTSIRPIHFLWPVGSLRHRM